MWRVGAGIAVRRGRVHVLGHEVVGRDGPMGWTGVKGCRGRAAGPFDAPDSPPPSLYRSPQYRSVGCGEISASHEGREVRLAGWVTGVRSLGAVVFAVVRDSTGDVQVVLRDPGRGVAVAPADASARWLPRESAVRVDGTVARRPQDATNLRMATGAWEVVGRELQVLNRCVPVLPLEPGGGGVGGGGGQAVRPEGSEDPEAWLRHRTLALRGDRLQRALRTRASASSAARLALEAQGFVEVETPTLFRATAEGGDGVSGAREFRVPSRRHPGKSYALPQSPQQWKQMLVAGGFERYFQVARCYRDEDGRSDRQPEFTQVDLEMAFAGAADVQRVAESVVRAVHARVGLGEPTFERTTHAEAMAVYGSDKPDLRRPVWEVSEVPDGLKGGRGHGSSSSSSSWAVLGTVVETSRASGVCPPLSRRARDRLREEAKRCGLREEAGERLWVLPVVGEGGRLDASGVYPQVPGGGLSRAQERALVGKSEREIGDRVVVVAGPRAVARETVRGVASLLSELSEGGGGGSGGSGGSGDTSSAPHKGNNLRYLWVTGFPLFKRTPGNGMASEHHPFTAPVDEHVEGLLNGTLNPLEVGAQHFDLVCNGQELGGGSVRIHDPALQRHIMERVLGLSSAEVDAYAHLLRALEYGCPPHAGFAFGLDRWAALLTGADSLRDVIAFPKSQTGACLLTDSPS